ncbi:MAG TPA: hypothetical protein VND64_14480 [Pirellulales bacterium]|nr:hypothetical protein [Pirellulales bacterium]
MTVKVKKTKAEVALERRAKSIERRNTDRRAADQPVAVERRQLERREKVNRRRQIDPTTCERDYSVEEVEFMNALDEYKRKSGRMFPTCSEILEVVRGLGYARPGAVESITAG